MSIKALALTALLCVSVVGCGYNKTLRDYSSTYTPIHSAVLVQSIILLKHLKSVVVAYVEKAKAENPDEEVVLEMRNPLYDPDDPESEELVYVNAEDYIKEIDYNIEKLLELAEGQEILNESIQQNRGLAPLLDGIKEAMSDEELIELIKRYGPLILRGE